MLSIVEEQKPAEEKMEVKEEKGKAGREQMS